MQEGLKTDLQIAVGIRCSRAAYLLENSGLFVSAFCTEKAYKINRKFAKCVSPIFFTFLTDIKRKGTRLP